MRARGSTFQRRGGEHQGKKDFALHREAASVFSDAQTYEKSIYPLFNHNNYSITLNHYNHRVLTICLTLYRSMNRFEKSFQRVKPCAPSTKLFSNSIIFIFN